MKKSVLFLKRKSLLFTTAIAVTRVSAFWCWFSEPQFSCGDAKGAQQHLCTQWLECERNPELRKPKSFVMGSKYAFPLLCIEILSSFSKVVPYITILEKTFWHKGHTSASLTRPTETRDPWGLSPTVMITSFLKYSVSDRNRMKAMIPMSLF